MDVESLILRLGRAAAGEVRADPATRELYAADASLYRRVPIAALRAAEPSDLSAALEACRLSQTPLTMRGAGTSLAGQTVGRGLVVDTTALADVEVDPDARMALVGPGATLASLNHAARAHGLIFGPDVATETRATLGGMIANNSAGARSVAYGLTADAVRALDVTFADGTEATLRKGDLAPARLAGARRLADSFVAPTLLRRVSGYNLDALAGDVPDWPRVIAGSEGTLCVIRRAELELAPLPPTRGLALMPFGSVHDALSSVADLLALGPSAIELLDESLLDPANRPPEISALLGTSARAPATLMVEFSGEGDPVAERLAQLDGATVLATPSEQSAMWDVRRSSIARALRIGGAAPGMDPRPLPFVEDPAVPPESVARFAAEARRLLDAEGVPAVWYGHASVGCLHIRPMIDLRRAGAAEMVRRIAEDMAALVARHGGSLSGEHGDGRARSELLPRMYPPKTIAAFRELKQRLDPDRILNPGVVVDPEPLDSGFRLLASPPRRARTTAISFSHEGGLARAAEACNGNGACRSASGLMCPSYQALHDERHSTRGRAVLLRAAIEGRLPAGLADSGLHDALDLCLSCKGCATACPAEVDMARLKVEALAARRRATGLPLRAHLAGRTRLGLSLASRAPSASARLSQVASRLVGRRLPQPHRRWRPRPAPSSGPSHTLFADTFTRYLEPHVGDSAIRALSAAGASVELADSGCCGRPLLSAGLVPEARRAARRALARLAPLAIAGTRIVVLEPSCWSMLVDDIPKLIPDDPRTAWVAESTVSFERALIDLEPRPRSEGSGQVVRHAHCHSRSLGSGGELGKLLEALGVGSADTGAGCCGMAGAFGYLHPEVSRTVASDRFLPALDNRTLVASGTSCRAQARELGGVTAVHPAELAADRLR